MAQQDYECVVKAVWSDVAKHAGCGNIPYLHDVIAEAIATEKCEKQDCKTQLRLV